MAKVRHRVFEIYETLDEAIREVLSRTDRTTLDVTNPAEWTFKYVSVAREAGVTLVRFTQPQLAGEEIISGVRDDFSKLADQLSNDSRVLIDFTAVETSSSSIISILNLISKKLRTKGSRLVLCGCNDKVKAIFFAAQ